MELPIIISAAIITAPITLLIIFRLAQMIFAAINHMLPYLAVIFPTYDEVKAAYANIGWHFVPRNDYSTNASHSDVNDNVQDQQQAMINAGYDYDEMHLYNTLMNTEGGPRAEPETMRAVDDLLAKINKLGICVFARYGSMRIMDSAPYRLNKLQIVILNRDQKSRDYFMSDSLDVRTIVFYNPFTDDPTAESQLFELVRKIMSTKHSERTYDVPGPVK